MTEDQIKKELSGVATCIAVMIVVIAVAALTIIAVGGLLRLAEWAIP